MTKKQKIFELMDYLNKIVRYDEVYLSSHSYDLKNVALYTTVHTEDYKEFTITLKRDSEDIGFTIKLHNGHLIQGVFGEKCRNNVIDYVCTMLLNEAIEKKSKEILAKQAENALNKELFRENKET